jgi:hypothetical protein
MALNPEKYQILKSAGCLKYETDSPQFEKANLSSERYLRLQQQFWRNSNLCQLEAGDRRQGALPDRHWQFFGPAQPDRGNRPIRPLRARSPEAGLTNSR